MPPTTTFARLEHGIPVVANATERAALFPNPGPNQRVQNLASGYIERWDGSVWQQEIPVGNGGPMLNVRAFGATGGGSIDDRASIQKAIDAALAAGGGTVWCPPGTYYLNSYYPAQSTYILKIDGGSGAAKTVTLLGAPGAVFTTPLYYDSSGVATETVRLTGALEDCVVEGIDFRNTHPVIAGRTLAIVADDGTTRIKRLKIRRNIFRNHARTIQASGVDGLDVTENSFLYTNGRDSGNTVLADPNVGVWPIINSAAMYVANVLIKDNYFDGCTSGDVSGNVNKQGLDGLVFGHARGYSVIGNRIIRPGTEAIYINQHQSVDGASRWPNVVVGNIIDCTNPTGDTTNGSWGIRSDDFLTTITGNAIRGGQQGILVSGSGLANPLSGIVIADNVLDMKVSPGISSYGIKVDTVTAPTLANNIVSWAGTPANGGADLYGIFVFASTKGRLRGNQTRAAALPASGSLHGVYFQQTSSMRVDGHTSEFCTNAFYEHQHSGGQPGTRIAKITSISCTNKITGDDINELTVEENLDRISADKGDVNYTVLTGDPEIILFASNLTANRTVTLTNVSSAALANGRRVTILCLNTAAFTLTVQTNTPTTLKLIPASTKARVECMIDASGNWFLTNYTVL